MKNGQFYATQRLTNDQNLVFAIDEKVEIFQKVELRYKRIRTRMDH